MAKANKRRNYEEDKAKLKAFLAEFHEVDERGNKNFVYARQLVTIAHREQVRRLCISFLMTKFKPLYSILRCH